MPPADAFIDKEKICAERSFPLEVVRCDNPGCNLVQLGYVVSPEILYQRDYPYESSMTKTGVEHFHGFARAVTREFGLKSSDLVIDVGSNVGVLLEGFKKEGVKILGVEPAPNICRIANKRGIRSINRFFNRAAASFILRKHGKASIITGTNVIAHIDNSHELVDSVRNLLKEGGIFVFEAPYLFDLIDNLEYDTIYHEHLSYFSVKPLAGLFARFDMQIFDVRKQSIHGGSLRYFVARKGERKVSHRVENLLAFEKRGKVHALSTLNGFARRVADNRRALVELLQSLKKTGKRLVGVGAPAKGMTLLNYCNIGPDTLDYITEKSKLKIGRVTPGTHIRVVPDSRLIKDRPDYALLLPWNFADEIMANLSEFTKQGGRFIIPIPRPQIKG